MNSELKMASEDFEVGDLVWAKMKGYPLWPGKIEQPLSDAKPPKNKKAHFVYFFGTKNFAWILDENINQHNESMLNTLGKKKSAVFQRAIEDFKNNQNIKNLSKKKKYKMNSKISPKVVANASKKVNKVFPSKALKKHSKKRVFDSSVNRGCSECTSPKRQKLAYDEKYTLHGSTPPIDNSVNAHGSACDAVSAYVDNVRKCQRPNSLLQGKVPRKHLKIGFIGLGQVGMAIVKTFLKDGYNVTVWNKTHFKCDELVKLRAKKAQSPAELFVNCNIIFSCVADPEASKSLIFGERGILEGLEQAEQLGFRDRGYVEMTSLDPKTSQEIAEAIGRKNGRYLEAPICGYSDDILNRNLIIHAAGDRRLFLNCEFYFKAISKYVYYLSSEVGTGAKHSLLLNTYNDTTAALASECFRLVKELNLKEDIFLAILASGPLQPQTFSEKCSKMLERDYTTDTPLKYVQNHMDYSLRMASKVRMSMPITAASNEIYKHTLLQYADSDVSAIFEGVYN